MTYISIILKRVSEEFIESLKRVSEEIFGYWVDIPTRGVRPYLISQAKCELNPKLSVCLSEIYSPVPG